MQGSTIFFIVFFGMIFGVLFGVLILKRIGNRQRKNAIGRIKNQNMNYRIGGKEHNFLGNIEKALKKKKSEIEEKKRNLFFKKKSKDNFPSAPIEDYGVNLKDKKERRSSAKFKKKEKKKHPYKKVRKGVKKK